MWTRWAIWPSAARAFAELEALVAIDRRVAVLDHVHEDVSLREYLLDRGRRIGIGRHSIVLAERLLLGADDFLRGGNVVGERRRTKPDKECND